MFEREENPRNVTEAKIVVGIASYNEESGRYRELRPVFYVPGP